MDREEIEDVVHASLGRHLRITCVLGLLFLVVGFVLGHYVAAQHSRQLSDRWTDRAGELTKQMAEVEEKLRTEWAQVRERDQASETTHIGEARQASQRAETDRHEELLAETRRLARASEDLRRSLIARCIEENEQEKARILNELQPYLDRKMTVQAAEVSEAINRLVETQVNQLKTLAQVELPGASTPALALQLQSHISPVSAQSDAAQCPAPDHSPLTPVAESPTPAGQESVALLPMPRTLIVRMPAQAEPTSNSTTQPVGNPQFFTAPRQPRLYIPARKPVEVSTAAESEVR